MSDARNDAVLDRALKRLPRGSGLVFRHYHLPDGERRARFSQLARAARARGLAVFLAGDARQARRWRADGAYGSSQLLAGGPACARLVTVHGLRELARAGRADAVLLSPVFPTRTHPGAPSLGAIRFLLMAQKAGIPVLALGGMTARRAARLPVHGWAAIDGLSP
ncbi:thiamine phosphate synthase [Novosphingobium sp. TH158]|nr:thiamine phosphate synthase [Novosphingobium sp. TH158]